jgi:hypothetical protein
MVELYLKKKKEKKKKKKRVRIYDPLIRLYLPLFLHGTLILATGGD